MPTDAIDTATAVRRLILRCLPSSWVQEDLHEGVDLLGDELGLDSVAVVEVLSACEEQFRIPFPAELLAGEPLTVGRLVTHVRGQAPGESDPANA